ncbi:MAG: TIR domain-containing protein [Bacteroidales bacterium]|nr:TIR domain-containing protein [Bacteroidales bacterium]
MKLFLSYNSKNRTIVEGIADSLKKNGFEIFFDKESIGAGDIWAQKIQTGIESSNATLVFIGEEGIGAWQNKEIIAIVNDCIKKSSYKVIPVLIPTSNKFIDYRLPWFLSDYQWVEFNDTNDNHALSKLLESLRGKEKENNLLIGQNPYKGLDSFEVDDDYCFFGRTFDLNQVFHSKLRFHVSIPKHNFLAIVADSGAGKSSFVKAGILSSLKKGKFPGSEKWKQIIFKPGSNPLSALSSSLKQKSLIPDSRQFEEQAQQYDDQLLRVIRDQVETLVIYIDQFEEVIAQCRDEKERVSFLNNISCAVKNEKAIILLTLRSDFYAKFSHYPLFKTLIENNNYTLSEIAEVDDDENRIVNSIRQIIAKPAKNAGVEIKDNLVEKLILDTRCAKGALPVLELTLDLLWKNKRNSTEITLEDYDAISNHRNLAGIIQTHADKVFNDITSYGADKAKAELFKKIFVPYLVEISRTGEDVRRTALKEDLLGIKGNSKDEIEDLLQYLTSDKSRLLKIRQENNHPATVDVVHEVVIREWPLLKNWINERREALLYLERLRMDAADWNLNKSNIYKGRNLKKAKQWQENNPDLADNSIDTFIESSVKKTHSHRRLLVGLSLILITLSIISYKPIQIWNFKRDIEDFPSVKEQVEWAGGDIDSIKFLSLNNENYGKIIGGLFHFKNLKILELKETSMGSLSSINENSTIETLALNRNVSMSSLKGIERFRILKSLTIGDSHNLKNLDGIEKLSSLKSLTIDINNLTSIAGIERINSLKSLTVLGNNNLINLSGIENIHSLEELTIENTNHINLTKIQKLRRLKSLTIINNDSLTNIAGIEQLQLLDSLRVSGNNLISPNGIEKLKSLKYLDISENENLTSIVEIKNLQSLKTLSISGCNNLVNLAGIENLQSLKTLSISSCYDLTSLAGIENLQSLETLSIFSCDNLASLTGVENLQSLKTLSINRCNNLNNLSGIKNLQSLKTLIIYNCNKLTNLAGIEKLKSLTSLGISQNYRLKSLGDLKKLKLLKKLNIVYDNTPLFNVDFVYDLRNLQELYISKVCKVDYNIIIKNNPGIKIVREY